MPYRVTILFLFFMRFRGVFETFLEPKSGPKVVNFWVKFWNSFFWFFGALWVPLGSLLGPLEVLLEGFWTQKP